MIVIGYGVAALIVIVLLIVFNVRAGAKRPNAGEETGARLPEPEKDTVQAEPAAVPVPADREPPVPKPPAQPDPTGDRSYRNALRQLQTTQAPRKPAKAADVGSADSEYREAMRRLRQSKERKE